MRLANFLLNFDFNDTNACGKLSLVSRESIQLMFRINIFSDEVYETFYVKTRGKTLKKEVV